MAGYIYAIANRINNKIYIGQTIDYIKRKKQHFRELRINKHVNENLQYDFNKYGEINFKFFIIEKVKEDLLTEREQYWIDYYKNIGNIYNIKLKAINSKVYKMHSQITIYFIIITIIGFLVYLFNVIFKIKLSKYVYCIIMGFVLLFVFLWTFNYFGVI